MAYKITNVTERNWKPVNMVVIQVNDLDYDENDNIISDQYSLLTQSAFKISSTYILGAAPSKKFIALSTFLSLSLGFQRSC